MYLVSAVVKIYWSS